MWDMDILIKRATILTVAIVAGIAAWISYTHIYVVGGHNPLLPISVDGMIVTSSLVLLTAHRAKLSKTLWLARFTLWLGISATLLANVDYGLSAGALSAVVSAWPAVCFVFTVETVMQLAKAQRLRKRVNATHGPTLGVTPVAAVLANREPVYAKATVDRMAAHGVDTPRDLPNKGKVPSIRQIRTELSCGQPIATEVQQIMMRGKTDNIQTAYKLRNEARNG